MIPVTDAWQTILRHAVPLPPVRVPLAAALGRTLRTAACADSDSPPFDASAMDGYALRRAEATAPLRVVGTSQAGTAFAGKIGPGECIRIFTGAPVPPDADCVVKQEDTVRDGAQVRITNLSPGPTFIRRRGENRRAGDIVVPAGTRLGPPELAALAGIGVHQPEVTRAPRCAHLVTGNELVAPDQTPVGAQIRDSNSTLLAALLARSGAELVSQPHSRDDLAQAQAEVAALPAYDILFISGGASVGDHDIARPLLTALGYTLHFHALNLRPGKPLVFASRDGRLAFALPGNPVSHWVVFQLFIAPLLELLQTGVAPVPARLTGRLTPHTKTPPPDSRQTYWPARAVVVQGGYEITPLPLASSGDASGLVGANALLPLPPHGLDPTQPVEFIDCR
jgi:molybdopterin molybdotransferase